MMVSWAIDLGAIRKALKIFMWNPTGPEELVFGPGLKMDKG
jgi:hypothetical protein